MFWQMAKISMVAVILGIASGDCAFATKALQWGDKSVAYASDSLTQVPLYISNSTLSRSQLLSSYVKLFGNNNNILLLEKNGALPSLAALFAKLQSAGINVSGVYTNSGGNNSVLAYDSNGVPKINSVIRSRTLKLLEQNSTPSDNLVSGTYVTLEPGSSECVGGRPNMQINVWGGCIDTDKKCAMGERQSGGNYINGYVTRYKNTEMICDTPCMGTLGVIENSHSDSSCGQSTGGNCVQLYCRCNDGYVPSNRSCVAAIPNGSGEDGDCPSGATYVASGYPAGVDKWDQSSQEHVRGGWATPYCRCIVDTATEWQEPDCSKSGWLEVKGTGKCCPADWYIESGMCKPPYTGAWVAESDGVGGLYCIIPYGDNSNSCKEGDEYSDNGCPCDSADPDGTPGGCWCSADGECGNKCDGDHVVSNGGFGCVSPCANIGPYNVVVDMENCSDPSAYDPAAPGGCLAQYCACPDGTYPWVNTNPSSGTINPYKCVTYSHDCPDHAVSFEDNDSQFIPEGREYKGDLGVELGQISEYCHCEAGYGPWKGSDGNASIYCEEMSVIAEFWEQNTPDGAAPSDSCRGHTSASAVGTLGGCVCTNYVASYSSNNGVCSFACIEGYIVAEGRSSCVPACDVANATFNTSCTAVSNVGASRGCTKKYCQCDSGYVVGENGTCVEQNTGGGE